MNKITFTVLADLHYKKGMYIASVSDLEKIMDRAKSTNSDFVIHCGDFSNDYKGSPEIVNAYLHNENGLEVYGIYGNHELETGGNTMQFVTPLLTNRIDEVVWGNDSGTIENGDIAYYYFDKNNFRIICLDSNYSYNSELEEWQHNLEASWGEPQGNLYSNSLGPVQLKWLEKLLLDSAKENKRCIIVSHSTLNPNWRGNIKEIEKVNEMVNNVNNSNPGTVLMIINGHDHDNLISVSDQVVYMSVNTVVNGYWCESGFKHYSDEQTYNKTCYNEKGEVVSNEVAPINTLSMSEKTWFFDSPLSAVISISDDGKIDIDGATANWLYGVTPENVPNSRHPKIDDLAIDLKI